MKYNALVALFCALQLVMLAACGGGGGSDRGLVRTAPPPPPPVIPPPPPASSEPCPAPITGVCYVEVPFMPTWDEIRMTGGRQSDYGLFVTSPAGSGGGGWLNLTQGVYRFGGGTTIAGAGLVVWDTLVSDVEVAKDFTGLGFSGTSELWLSGTVRGNVTSDALVSLRHRCGTGLNICVEDNRSVIEGNYRQSQYGTLQAVLGWELWITGTAAIDGLLEFVRGTSHSYVLPTAPSSVLVLHANNGVSGQFDRWTSPSLFLEGSLRYTPNDVYFDLTRVALRGALEAANADTPEHILDAAGNVDAAFEQADRYAAGDAALSRTQRAFLASAASIQHLVDIDQAHRTLDSLSGRTHGSGERALRAQGQAFAASIGSRLDAAGFNATPFEWRAPLNFAGGQTTAGGTAQWLGPRWLVGGSVVDGSLAARDDAGGFASAQAPMVGVHAHYRGDGWHATGLATAGRASLTVDRRIDLGDGASHATQARRMVDQFMLHGELGRRLSLGRARLTPFAAIDHVSQRNHGFSEHGSTGFELIAHAARDSHWSGALGTRLSHAWTWRGHSAQLALEARYMRQLAHQGEGQRSAFAGTPGAAFLLPGAEADEGAGFGLELDGALRSGWIWSLQGGHAWSGGNDAPAWRMELLKSF